MDQNTHNKIVSFIWGIADDVLRDLFKRGKYPDVILPMCVLRRMDAVLEPTKKAVLETKQMLDKAGITVNKNAIPFDTKSPFVTSGIRIGTAAATTRGMREPEMRRIAAWIAQILANAGDTALQARVRAEVTEFARLFQVP